MTIDENNVHEYKFSIPCDAKGITVVLAAHDNRNKAISMAREAITKDRKFLAENQQMNKLLMRRYLGLDAQTKGSSIFTIIYGLYTS